MESIYKLTGLFLVLFEICCYQFHNVAVAGDVQRRDISGASLKGFFMYITLSEQEMHTLSKLVLIVNCFHN